MPLIIYADVLFAVNLIMDTITLCVCAKVLSLRPAKSRIVVSAFTGAIYSVISIYINLPEPTCAVVASVVMCLICFGRRPIVIFGKIILLFYAVGMLSGGIISFLYGIFYRSRNTYLFNNGLTFGTFIFFSGVVWIFLTVISKFFNVFASRKTTKLQIITENRKFKFTLLCDTGNLLICPYSGLPVIVMKAKCLKPVLGVEGDDIENGIKMESVLKHKFRYISVHTVAGKVLMPGFHFENICTVSDNGKCKKISAVIACDNVSGADYGGFDGVIPYTLCE